MMILGTKILVKPFWMQKRATCIRPPQNRMTRAVRPSTSYEGLAIYFTYSGITPSTDSDTSTRWHPFAVLTSWHGQSCYSRVQREAWAEFKDTDIVCLSSTAVIWMIDPGSNGFALLRGFVSRNVVSTTNSGNTGAFAMGSGNNTVSTNNGTTTKVRSKSLKGDNVWLRIRRWDWSTDNLENHWWEVNIFRSYFDRAVGSSHSEETGGEFHFEFFFKSKSESFVIYVAYKCRKSSDSPKSADYFTRKIWNVIAKVNLPHNIRTDHMLFYNCLTRLYSFHIWVTIKLSLTLTVVLGDLHVYYDVTTPRRGALSINHIGWNTSCSNLVAPVLLASNQ